MVPRLSPGMAGSGAARACGGTHGSTSTVMLARTSRSAWPWCRMRTRSGTQGDSGHGREGWTHWTGEACDHCPSAPQTHPLCPHFFASSRPCPFLHTPTPEHTVTSYHSPPHPPNPCTTHIPNPSFCAPTPHPMCPPEPPGPTHRHRYTPKHSPNHATTSPPPAMNSPCIHPEPHAHPDPTDADPRTPRHTRAMAPRSPTQPPWGARAHPHPPRRAPAAPAPSG